MYLEIGGKMGGMADKYPEVEEFVIDVDTWLRGERGDSFLLRESDGKRCCVGQWLSARGFPDKDLIGVGAACGVDFGGITDLGDLYNVNDDRELTEAKRRGEVRSFFKALLGVGVAFSDEIAEAR